MLPWQLDDFFKIIFVYFIWSNEIYFRNFSFSLSFS